MGVRYGLAIKNKEMDHFEVIHGFNNHCISFEHEELFRRAGLSIEWHRDDTGEVLGATLTPKSSWADTAMRAERALEEYDWLEWSDFYDLGICETAREAVKLERCGLIVEGCAG